MRPFILATLLFLPLALQSCASPSPTRSTATQSPLPQKTDTQRLATTKPGNPTRTATENPLAATIAATATPYPIFDPASAPAATSPSRQVCPTEGPEVEVSVPSNLTTILSTQPELLSEYVFRALNAGASASQVSAAFGRALRDPDALPLRDLTGDGQPELLVPQLSILYVFGCVDGNYQQIIEYGGEPTGPPEIALVKDLNRNRIPEVAFSSCLSTACFGEIDIFEWDGKHFRRLIQVNHGPTSPTTSRWAKALYWYGDTRPRWEAPVMNGPASIRVTDPNRDGFYEVQVSDQGPIHFDTLCTFGPWRPKTLVFEWDGIHFLYTSLHLAEPQYRFQAVQEADRLFLLGQYDEAVDFYQEAIFSNELGGWSRLLAENYTRSCGASIDGFSTPILPAHDPLEYQVLSAYARYRIAVSYLARGWLDDAATVLQALQSRHPEGNEGHDFAKMAITFSDTLEASGDLHAACAAALEEFRDDTLLVYLGSDHHGGQSHHYDKADLCPF